MLTHRDPLFFGILSVILSFGKGLVFFTPAIFLNVNFRRNEYFLKKLYLTMAFLVWFLCWFILSGGLGMVELHGDHDFSCFYHFLILYYWLITFRTQNVISQFLNLYWLSFLCCWRYGLALMAIYLIILGLLYVIRIVIFGNHFIGTRQSLVYCGFRLYLRIFSKKKTIRDLCKTTPKLDQFWKSSFFWS